MSPDLKVSLAQVKDAIRQLEEAWAVSEVGAGTIDGLSAYLGRALENAYDINRAEQNAREQARLESEEWESRRGF